MNKTRVNFIEWMKALGMLVIIYGHTNGHAIFNPTLPANFKQIGVVFFILATGYLLANETRPWIRVFFKRLFELFLFGILFAVLMSAVRMYAVGDLNESNYLPFMLGANVLFNAFPANPSTWYIGTYIHLLIAWALLLRNIRVQLWMFLIIIPVEIAIRALLMEHAGDFVAYQALTNWASVLMLGMYMGQRSIGDRLDDSPVKLVIAVAALAAAVAGWMWLTRTLGVTANTPLGRLQWGGEDMRLALTAASVSVVYLMWAILGFQVLRRFRAGPIVQFFGRNSMIIFIIHMPMIYLIGEWLYSLPGIDSSAFIRLGVNLLIFYVGAGLISELLRKLINPLAIRNAIERRFAFLQSAR